MEVVSGDIGNGCLDVTGLRLAQPVEGGLTFILTQVIVVMAVRDLRRMDLFGVLQAIVINPKIR